MSLFQLLRPRWRKVLIDLWENKARTMLVVASIAIGVFAVGMIAGAYVYISEDLNTSYSAVNPANIKLWTDPFNDGLLDTLETLDLVGSVEGRRVVTVRVRTGQDEWQNLNLIALPDFSNIQVNRLVTLEGAGAIADRQVVLAENNKLDRSGLRLGDELEIELSDGTLRQIPFVGIIQDQAAGMENLTGNVFGYVTFDTLEWLHQPLSYNQVVATVAELPEDKAHIQAVADQLTDKIEKSGRSVYRTVQLKREHPLSSIVDAMLGVLFILGILIVFLSGSLISNTLNALLNQHMRQIGVMKLVGARRSQVVQMYLVLIVAFGMIALLVSVPLGSQAAYALSLFAADLIVFNLQGFRIMPLVIILQVIIGLAVPPLAGLLPVLRGSRISVVKAISSTGIEGKPASKNWFDRALKRIRGVSRPILISLRNTFRRKGRLALTLFTMTLGGAIFISVFNVQESLNLKIEQTARYFMADVNLDFERSYRIQLVQQIAMSVPGVEQVEGWAVTGAELLDESGTVVENVSVIGLPADSRLVEPKVLKGRWLLPDDQNAILVNEAFWDEYPDLAIGDVLNLKINGKESGWVVAGIFQYTGMTELFAYSNYEALANILKKPGQATAFRLVTTDHSPEFQQGVTLELDRLFRDEGFRVQNVEAGAVTTRMITDYIGILTAILLIMAVLTAVVGSIGLAGTLSMNVMERTREIGVMRAIGAYNQIVMKLVVIEGVLISLISYFFGAVLAFPITAVLSDVVSLAIFNSPAEFAFTFQGFAIWLGLVIVLSVVASIIPARSASRMTIREVLAYE